MLQNVFATNTICGGTSPLTMTFEKKLDRQGMLDQYCPKIEEVTRLCNFQPSGTAMQGLFFHLRHAFHYHVNFSIAFS